MSQVKINLLGGFQLWIEGDPAPVNLRTRKARALLAYLAMNPGRREPRETLADLLWGNRGQEQSRHSLRQMLVDLRRSLPEPASSAFHDGDELYLDDAWVDVDALRFETLVSGASEEQLIDASELYRGEFLRGLTIREEAFEDWGSAQRSRLHELAVECLSRLVSIQAEKGERELGIQVALRLLSIDPLDESAHRWLMKLYADLGRRDAALKQYEECRSLLDRELGIEPDDETTNLCSEIRDGKAPPETPAARKRSPSRRQSILVVEDDPISRSILDKYLRSERFDVTVATDGEDALEKLSDAQFDLILSDIRMPKMSGLELLAALNKQKVRTPAIFLTAITDDELEVKSLKLGASDFIRKPIRKDILLLRVRNALRTRK